MIALLTILTILDAAILLGVLALFLILIALRLMTAIPIPISTSLHCTK